MSSYLNKQSIKKTIMENLKMIISLLFPDKVILELKADYEDIRMPCNSWHDKGHTTQNALSRSNS